MSEWDCPSKEKFQTEILELKEIYTTGGVVLRPRVFAALFQKKDEHDNTNVFDFINAEWFDKMYGKIELVTESWYVGDGSFEHRVAYVMVAINVGHMLQNGNKRSSILVLFVLCSLNGSMLSVDCPEDAIFDLAKDVAKAGNDKKEESVSMVREFLKNNLEAIH